MDSKPLEFMFQTLKFAGFKNDYYNNDKYASLLVSFEPYTKLHDCIFKLENKCVNI